MTRQATKGRPKSMVDARTISVVLDKRHREKVNAYKRARRIRGGFSSAIRGMIDEFIDTGAPR